MRKPHLRPDSLALSLLIASLLITGSMRADALVVPGVGTIGSWDTEFELSNPFSYRLSFQIGEDPAIQRGCPGFCNFATLGIPPKGSLRLRQADIFPTNRLYVLWVLPLDGSDALPTLRARVTNSLRPLESVELPVTRSSTISRADTTKLGFPSVMRTATAHSNLILANLEFFTNPGTTLVADVDLYDTSGERLGGMRLSVEARQLVFLGDVVSVLGIAALPVGQVVVTQTSTGGTPWGLVATVDSTRGVAISPGRNP